MADDQKSKLPAWQLANGADESKTASTPAQSSTEASDAVPKDETSATSDESNSSSSVTLDKTEEEQRELVQAFLKDESVKEKSADEKRAFLHDKGMSTKIIEEELGSATQAPFQESDFKTFQQKISPQPAPIETATHSDIPPIITYPEFLANAHRPEPLVTPGRILATTYVASAAAALLYGASTLLVKPMTAVLTDARHEFALHGQSKIQELNARLEKMVSQVPGAKIGTDTDSDVDSLVSEPTELWHRDVGTQTDTSVNSKPAQVAFVNNDSSIAHADQLKTLETELTKLLTGINAQGDAVREREESVSKLRHYLDSLAYSGNNVWSHNGVGYGWEASKTAGLAQEKKTDPIEDLKREIRGVKGVLLSAKRFPAAAHSTPNSRYKAPAQAPA